jgi:putative SOS response-associated peptidase YedK
MCGRFLLTSSMDEVIKRYNIIKANSEGFSVGEVFPGSTVLMIHERGARSSESGRWGYFIPSLNKHIINIRYETIDIKNDFKSSFNSRRCIIPVNAFYEWKSEGTHKKKYKFSLEEQDIFSLAGIYKDFVDKSGMRYTGLGIITVPSKGNFKAYHHRMPLTIEKEKENLWLSGNTDKILQEVKDVFINDNIKYFIGPAGKEIQLSFLS